MTDDNGIETGGNPRVLDAESDKRDVDAARVSLWEKKGRRLYLNGISNRANPWIDLDTGTVEDAWGPADYDVELVDEGRKLLVTREVGTSTTRLLVGLDVEEEATSSEDSDDDSTAADETGVSDAQAAAVEAVTEGLKLDAVGSGRSLESAIDEVVPNPDDGSQVAIVYDPDAEIDVYRPGEGKEPQRLADNRVELGMFGEMVAMVETTIDDLPGPNPPQKLASFVDANLDAAGVGVNELDDGREALVLHVEVA